MRVIAFIDGFNLYHAVDDLKKPHLKWVDLRQVCEVFCPPPDLDLLDLAYRNAFDRALIVSGDSDLVPAVRMVRERFPEKSFRIIAPVGRGFSMDLLNVAGGKRSGRRMKESHLEFALLPGEVLGADGRSLIVRPTEYDPTGC